MECPNKNCKYYKKKEKAHYFMGCDMSGSGYCTKGYWKSSSAGKESRCDMVLNVTEEQKKLIESQGYMVVEFKLWYRKLGEMLIDYASRWIDTWKAIMLFLQEKIAKAVETLIDLSERLLMEFKLYVEQLEYVNSREHREYEFVRSLCKTYRLNLSKKVVYHRCRDRC